MKSFDLEGKLHKVFETQSKTQTFQTREFVVEQSGPYPQFIKFQLTQERCDIIGNYKEGDMVKVHFDLRGREWNESYFTNLNAWKVEAGSAEVSPEENTKEEGFTEIVDGGFPKATDEVAQAEEIDDLPF